MINIKNKYTLYIGLNDRDTHINLDIEKSIEFIAEDELVEVTPKNIRLRKIILNNKDREKAARK